MVLSLYLIQIFLEVKSPLYQAKDKKDLLDPSNLTNQNSNLLNLYITNKANKEDNNKDTISLDRVRIDDQIQETKK